jgi:hypothetical protein
VEEIKDIYIKKFWDEENVLFLTHFSDNYAVRQIEVWQDKTLYLSEENIYQDDSMLYDGKYDELDLKDTEFITYEEFEKEWAKQTK